MKLTISKDESGLRERYCPSRDSLHGINFTCAPMKRTSGSSQTLNFSPTLLTNIMSQLYNIIAGRIALINQHQSLLR
jgi:hypothetical protein